jgi:hypothetical protein
MRDPKRIPKILDLLKDLWNLYPDQRFLQLLSNDLLTQADGDIFFIEDTQIEKWLEEEIFKTITFRYPIDDIIK